MPTTRIEDTAADVRLGEAARQLAKSEKGRQALRAVLDWLDADGCSLDAVNQEAVFVLLAGAWGGFAGTARDAMREALG
jgi:hypothetical protein